MSMNEEGGLSGRCERAEAQVVVLRRHKTEYMESAEETRKALESQLAALREELATAKRNEHNSEVAYKAAIEKQEELRAELADSEEELDTVIHHNIDLQQRLADAERRNESLRVLLRSASTDYACCLESGYDRITQLGGDCDSVEKMLDDNPNYARYIAALNPKPRKPKPCTPSPAS